MTTCRILKLIPPVDSNQIAKWFGTTYGFILGIFASFLTVIVISAGVVVVVGLIGGGIYYGLAHTRTQNCLTNRIKERRQQMDNQNKPSSWIAYINLSQLNACRKRSGLGELSKEEVKKKGHYEGILDPDYFNDY